MSGHRTWVRRWLTTTNHKDIGWLYFWTALLMMVIGGSLALLMRTQLMFPASSLISEDLYYQAVTMHGAVMVLFFISPFSFAFANYFVPLQIGARDLAFPRINALSYWLYLLGGLVAASGFLLGGAANVGWTFYSPLTSIEFSPGLGVDLAGIGLLLLCISVVVSTLNFLVTIFLHRAKGMRLYDMPIFTWHILFTLILMLVIFPTLITTLLMLIGDRHLGMHFFDPATGGTKLWIHLFWFFGHPEVYVLLLPGVGVLGEVIQAFSRRPLYGKRYILWALAVAVFLSLIVWGHHMFSTGSDPRFLEVMTITTEMISIPFGIIFLLYMATMWQGRIRFATPMLFVIGYFMLFLIGGLTGVFLSSLAIDHNLRGTYWVVAHFHFTLIGGVFMGMMAALYYWFPKMTGRMLSEKLGRVHFLFIIIGMVVTFIPQFFLGAMPRRIYTYAADTGWGTMNLISTIGAFLFAFGTLLMFINIFMSLRSGEQAPKDPWGGDGFEWLADSPPPFDNWGAESPVLRFPDATSGAMSAKGATVRPDSVQDDQG